MRYSQKNLARMAARYARYMSDNSKQRSNTPEQIERERKESARKEATRKEAERKRLQKDVAHTNKVTDIVILCIVACFWAFFLVLTILSVSNGQMTLFWVFLTSQIVVFPWAVYKCEAIWNDALSSRVIDIVILCAAACLWGIFLVLTILSVSDGQMTLFWIFLASQIVVIPWAVCKCRILWDDALSSSVLLSSIEDFLHIFIWTILLILMDPISVIFVILVIVAYIWGVLRWDVHQYGGLRIYFPLKIPEITLGGGNLRNDELYSGELRDDDESGPQRESWYVGPLQRHLILRHLRQGADGWTYSECWERYVWTDTKQVDPINDEDQTIEIDRSGRIHYTFERRSHQ